LGALELRRWAAREVLFVMKEISAISKYSVLTGSYLLDGDQAIGILEPTIITEAALVSFASRSYVIPVRSILLTSLKKSLRNLLTY
jgi:hypothetical protein